MRANLNQALCFAGLLVDDMGGLVSATRATKLPEAERRQWNCEVTWKDAVFTLIC